MQKQDKEAKCLGDFNIATISFMCSRASNYSANGDLAIAITLGEDCLKRMALVYGEFSPITLSAMFRLAMLRFIISLKRCLFMKSA